MNTKNSLAPLSGGAKHMELIQLDYKLIPKKCDVVVIGGGIGGLTCACYLAKAGAKVVLVEKHYMPGGYCSSFIKGSYYFDAGAHYLGSCRPSGQIGRLIADHQLERKITLIRCEPTEVIITKHLEVFIFSDVQMTISEFQKKFPREKKAVDQFFKYITNTEPLQLYLDMKELTFRDLLNQYFKDWEIKSAISTLLGNIGLPSCQASALTSVFLFREFIFDGGYYPKGGMQKFPDVLLERFREYGGVALLLSSAEEILLSSSGLIQAVRVKALGRTPLELRTETVVANCDPYQLYAKLLRNSVQPSKFQNQLETRTLTPSAFMVHLGINRDIIRQAKYHCNLWSYKRGDIDDYYKGVMEGKIEYGNDSFLFCSIPSFHDPELLESNRHSIQLIIAAPYYPREEWNLHKEKLSLDVINRLEQFIPGVTESIEIRQVAIPPTLVKYTWSYRGAMYGWASTPEQIGRRKFSEETLVDGLYMVGHWTGLPSGHSGIPTVVTSGRNVARIVLRKLRNRSNDFKTGPISTVNTNGSTKQ